MKETKRWLDLVRSSLGLSHRPPAPEGRQPPAGRFHPAGLHPQFQSSYIRESHALRPAAWADFNIDYWDFREDVEGFEKFFARHKDEFTGQPRQKNEIQTLFFPLRNETGRIMATVTLASPSLTAKLSRAREGLRLALPVLLLRRGPRGRRLFLVFAGFPPWPGRPVGLHRGSPFDRTAAPRPSLGALGKDPIPQPAKPSVAGFSSWGGLTRSPGDIFLTSIAALGLAVCLAVCAPGRNGEEVRLSRLRSILVHASAAALAAGAILALHEVVRRVVFNSNLSLLRWDFDISRLALQFGLFTFLVAVLIALAIVFRLASRTPRTDLLSGLAGALGAAAAILLGNSPSILLTAVSAALIAWLFAIAVVPGFSRRREVWFVGLVLAALWLSRSVDDQHAVRTHRLLETTVAHTILTRERGQFPYRGIAARPRPEPAADRFLFQGPRTPTSPTLFGKKVPSPNSTGTRASKSVTPKATRSAVSRSTSPRSWAARPTSSPPGTGRSSHTP